LFKPSLHHTPIHNPPQGIQVHGAEVLVVEVVGVFPDVEGQERGEAAGDGVGGAGFLGDVEGAVGGGGEPDPAGAEEGDAGGGEDGLEGIDRAPLFLDLVLEMPGRADDGSINAGNDRCNRLELRKIQVVVQDLAGVVEEGAIGLADDFFQGEVLQAAAGQELVQVVDIGLQVLAMVEFEGARADYGLQRIGRVRELNEGIHIISG